MMGGTICCSGLGTTFGGSPWSANPRTAPPGCCSADSACGRLHGGVAGQGQQVCEIQFNKMARGGASTRRECSTGLLGHRACTSHCRRMRGAGRTTAPQQHAQQRGVPWKTYAAERTSLARIYLAAVAWLHLAPEITAWHGCEGGSAVQDEANPARLLPCCCAAHGLDKHKACKVNRKRLPTPAQFARRDAASIAAGGVCSRADRSGAPTHLTAELAEQQGRLPCASSPPCFLRTLCDLELGAGLPVSMSLPDKSSYSAL